MGTVVNFIQHTCFSKCQTAYVAVCSAWNCINMKYMNSEHLNRTKLLHCLHDVLQTYRLKHTKTMTANCWLLLSDS